MQKTIFNVCLFLRKPSLYRSWHSIKTLLKNNVSTFITVNTDNEPKITPERYRAPEHLWTPKFRMDCYLYLAIQYLTKPVKIIFCMVWWGIKMLLPCKKGFNGATMIFWIATPDLWRIIGKIYLPPKIMIRWIGAYEINGRNGCLSNADRLAFRTGLTHTSANRTFVFLLPYHFKQRRLLIKKTLQL